MTSDSPPASSEHQLGEKGEKYSPAGDDSSPPASASHPHALRPAKSWQWILGLVALYSTALLYGLDTTIAAAVQGSVIEQFPGSIEKLAWVGVGFPLGSVAVILPTGYAYGMFNIKYLYLLSVLLFEAGSALCGAAPTMNALIGGRVLAGIGGAGMYLGALTYITVFTTLRERSLYVAAAGTVWGIGTVLGPVVGGSFAASSASWRWAFYINICIFAVTLPAMLLFLPAYQPLRQVTTTSKLRSLDWLGILLNAAIFTLWLLAVTLGSSQWGWSDYRTIIVWAVFGFALLAFIGTQYFTVFTTREHQLFPVEFLSRRSIVLLFVVTVCDTTALYTSTYFIPLLFQFVHSDSPIQAAVRLLPFICVLVFFMLLNGGLMPVLGYYSPWYILSGVFVLVGGALMRTIDIDTSPATVYGYSVLVAVGTGASMQAAYSIAPVKVDGPAAVSKVVGFINVAQIGGGVLALGIAGSIFQSVALSNLQRALSGFGFSLDDLQDVIAGAQSAVFRNASLQVQSLAIRAVVDAIAKVNFMAIAAGALLLLGSLAMRWEKLSFMPVTDDSKTAAEA